MLGSTRDARSAGNQLAITATPISTAVTAPYTRGSFGDTSNNSGASQWPADSASAEPDRHADQHDAERVAYDHRHDVGDARAERDAHAHLVRALRDAVRDHAVQTDRREHERQSAEDREHRRTETPRARHRREHICQWPRQQDTPPPASRAAGRAGSLRSAAPRSRAREGTASLVLSALRDRKVIDQIRLLAADRTELDVLGDSDDGATRRRVGADPDALANGILIRPQALRQRLVDDDDWRGTGAVFSCKPAPANDSRSGRREEARDPACITMSPSR